MHMLILAIVRAKDEESALERAKTLLARRFDRNDIDAFLTFDITFEFEGYQISAKDRWGDLPAVALADSEEGKNLISRGKEGLADEVTCFYDNKGARIKDSAQLEDALSSKRRRVNVYVVPADVHY